MALVSPPDSAANRVIFIIIISGSVSAGLLLIVTTVLCTEASHIDILSIITAVVRWRKGRAKQSGQNYQRLPISEDITANRISIQRNYQAERDELKYMLPKKKGPTRFDPL